jgi:flagellar basal-body rod protein FlgC
MDIFQIFALSSSGMGAQRTRMNVIAGNLANAETTRTPEGGPYHRRNVILREATLGQSFPALMSARLQGPLWRLPAVEVAAVQESSRPPRKVYDPGHADADPQGYVSYPDINSIEEMVDLLSAVRSYEANMAAFNATKSIVRRLLDMGRAI